MKKIIPALILVTFCFSCKTLNKDKSYQQLVAGASTQAQQLVTNSDYETCQFGKITRFDKLFLKNNLWGRKKLKEGSDPKLCSFKKGEYYGWKWELPNNASGVIGYPALQVGRNPFESQDASNSGLPIELSTLKALPVSYDVESHVKHRKYNLAFDLWLTDVSDYTLKNIQTEIMIWEDYFDFTSYGKKKGTIITPYGTYEVLEGHLKNPKFFQDWQYIAFVRTETRTAGTVDIAYFINYLVENNYVPSNHFLTSIEFGNEIGNSSGITLVKDFSWNIELRK